MEEKIFNYESSSIYYRVYGEGNPVLLVHGFGEDGSIWKNQVIELKKKNKLIIPDIPGSGKSEMIDDMSMSGIAEVMHAIIHEEKIDQCIVIGHSMGGYITLALVESYWNHVSAFGLFHSTAFPDTTEKKANRRKGIEFVKTHGPNEFLKTTTPNLFSPGTKENNPQLVSDFLDNLPNISGEAIIAYYESMIDRPDRTSILINTKNPVLFVAGRHDNAIPFDDVLKQCHLPEKSYFHIFENSGHMGMLEQHEYATRILDEFIQQSENQDSLRK